MDIYQLKVAYLDPHNPVTIDAERHDNLARARRCLVDAGDFERRYALLLGNFLAFEEYAAVSFLRDMATLNFSYEGSDLVLMEGNRHAINFFTSAKAYVDHALSDFKDIGEKRWFMEQVKKQTKEASDRSIHYRAAEQLRNSSQHFAMPITGYGPGPANEDRDCTWFYTTKEMLSKDTRVDQQKLTDLPDKIFLNTTLRGYMRELSGIHLALRKLVNEEVDRCRKLIEAAILDYRAAQKEPSKVSVTGAGVISARLTRSSPEESELVTSEAIPLLLDWDNSRLSLVEKHFVRVKLPF
ncbi:hypothetical protein [Lysobacter capsici]|uniref:hypothetical protein n=1 Tax=Lysobacter capsici TaxID=435897 RepID=UPI001C003793|nr:hypothetical protein [Lysobacter capsici]QWF19134.1 hypothetical protein KME82_10540 [Lysobacter capsici]